jgi:hypothetical protein
MAITRKPTDEQDYDAYLRKGGSAASPSAEGPKDVRFTLQIPGELCRQLDELRAQNPVRTSRIQREAEVR